MKSVLISIQPYWVFLIIAKAMGWKIDKEKTIEVRKNFPKAEDWNKLVKIYCSKDRKSFNRIPKEYQPLMQAFLGKVVGKWVCDKIYDIKPYFDRPDLLTQYECGWKHGKEFDCLSFSEMNSYLLEDNGYGWHISDLKIYDKPKELSEFYSAGWDMPCEHKKRGFNMDFCMAYENGSHFCKELICDKKRLTRPPQSWQFIEEGD